MYTPKTDEILYQLLQETIAQDTYFYGKVSTEIKISPFEKERILSEFPIPKLPVAYKPWSIHSLKDGAFERDVVCLVVSASIETKKTPYLKLMLSNSEGSFAAKMWQSDGNLNEALEFFTQNQIVKVSGNINEFPVGSGKKSLVIKSFLPVMETINPLALLPKADEDLEELTVELVTYLNELKEPHKSVALAGLKAYWSDFCIKPAAKGHHHAYLGGLLKHTLCMIRLVRYVSKALSNPTQAMISIFDKIETEFKREKAIQLTSDSPIHYSRIVWGGDLDHIDSLGFEFAKAKKDLNFNPDLVVAAVVWHDIAKVIEYSHFGEGDKYRYLFSYCSDIDSFDGAGKTKSGITTDAIGTRIGHMPMACMMFQSIIPSSGISLTLDDTTNYLHCILSHHGKLEWGSSVTPQTAEAYLLHYVDFIDSRYEKYVQTKKLENLSV